MHTPDVQARVPPVLVGQTTPQPPQLFTSLVVLTSQPSVRRLPLQSAKPALQVPVHALPEHTGVAMLFDEQAMPQPPQLVVLVVVLTHTPEQLVGVVPEQTQVPVVSQVPPVGVVQVPVVRGPTLQTEVVPEHTRVPVCAQPPVPAEVHAPEATHTPPQF